MTDGDRYSKGLGRSFKAIRPRLCSDLEPDSVRASLIVEYILKLLRKAVPSLAEIFGRATEEINRPNMLFTPALFLLSEQRSEPHTLGLEHLLESIRKTFERSGTPEDILSELAHRATSSLVTLVNHQKDYKDDLECRGVATRLAPLVETQLYGKLAQLCGIVPRAERVVKKTASQSALLDLPIGVLR